MTLTKNHNSNLATSIWPFALFMIGFYAIDCLLTYFNTSNKFLIWLLLPILFVSFVLRQNPISYLKLNTNIMKGIFWGAVISAINAAIHVAFWYFKNGTISIAWVGFKDFWNFVLLAPFTEEVLFRGVALGYLRNIYSFKTANIVNSVLFMLAHIPLWFASGQLAAPLYKVTYEFVRLFVIGLFWGFLVKKTNSLWASAIHHSANNFLASMVR